MNSIQHSSKQPSALSTHSNHAPTGQPTAIDLLNQALAASPKDRAELKERYLALITSRETSKKPEGKENFIRKAEELFDFHMKNAQPVNDSSKRNHTKSGKRSTAQKSKRVHVSAIRPDSQQTNPLNTTSNQIRTNQPTALDLLHQIPNANPEDQQELKALYLEEAILVANSITNLQGKISHIQKAEKLFNSQINKASSAESKSSSGKRPDYLGNISNDIELFEQLSLQPTTADSGEEG